MQASQKVLMQQVQVLGKALKERKEGKTKPSLVKRSLNKRAQLPSPRQALRQPSASFTAATLSQGAAASSVDVYQRTGSGGPHGGREVSFADQVLTGVSAVANLTGAANSGRASADHQPGGQGDCPPLTFKTAAASRTASAGGGQPERRSPAGGSHPERRSPAGALPSVAFPSSGTTGEEGKGGEYQCRARPSMSLGSIKSEPPSEIG